jgi:hypothetical protein
MGTRIHADISLPPGSPAGTYPLFDPGASSICVTYAAFSPDSPGRFVICTADVDGQRILSGWIPANAGAQRTRIWDSKTSLGGDAKPIVVVTKVACGFDASIDGELS